ncbi:MAG: hydroxymethylglutaryl-CoA lyase [Myxococcales bacterium]
MSRVLDQVPRRVRLVEVGPRDGLQNEPDKVPTVDKIAYIDLLTQAGLRDIEVTSFVRPARVPQLADAAEVFAGIFHREGVRYSALVPNRKGLENALAAGVRSIAVFTGATESFTRRNINMTIAESLDRFGEVVRVALAEGVEVRGYVSVCFGCPYEGAVDPGRVVQVAEALIGLGCYEVSIGDTIGVARPGQVEDVVGRLAEGVGLERVALHLHDTRGTALANVLTGLLMGVTTFDVAAGGLGGCPYAPGASGNLATEDLVYMLHGMGVDTGVDLDALVEASRFMSEVLHRTLPSKLFRAAIA